MLRHSLIAYPKGEYSAPHQPRFDTQDWLDCTPIRLPETIIVKKRLPPGAAAVLINQSHTDPDLVLPVSAEELRLVEAIDGERTIQEIIKHTYNSSPSQQMQSQARSLFERLWWYDQMVFAIHPFA
jgi:hypothetical protein